MIEGLISLATYYPVQGGLFGNVLFQWEQAGIFSYVLPFLIIFGIIFGLMDKLKIFDNKGINVVISIAAALMSLQFNLVSVFFAEIFPRVGIGLAILFAFLILVGLAFPKQKWAHWWFVGFMMVIFVVVLWNTFSAVGWNFGGGWNYYSMNWGSVAIIAVVIIGIIAIIGPNFKKPDPKSPGSPFESLLTKAIDQAGK